MRKLEFPIIGTKIEGLTEKFDLSSPVGRKAYFQAKAGPEIAQIQTYLNDHTFIAYFIGKKNSGKGTYSKMFSEIFGDEHVMHLSIGDLIREVHENWEKFSTSPNFEELKRVYRGFISFEDATDAFLGRSTDKLLPTEFVLALLKQHISHLQGKSIFIDGLPRETDQISYSLFFRDLINYRDDPDMFILLDVPESIISERIKYRVICPNCNTSRNTKLLITSNIEYDKKSETFHLVCDNPACKGARMVPKEGDELGIEPIRPRLDKDEKILKTILSIHGVPKILLRNHVPVKEAKDHFDSYELTPEYGFVWDAKNKKVKVTEKPWTVIDDNGTECFSLLAPPVTIALLKQLADVLK